MKPEPNFNLLADQFPDSCIIGNGLPDPDGYRRIGIGGQSERRRYYTHRLVYRAFVGELHSRHVVMHTCDNPACINPKHLRAGTHAQNMQDMVDKRRHEWGEDHYNAKLTADQVRTIRDDKRPHRVIAEEFGVTRSVVSNIKARRIWKHLEG